TWRPPRPRSRTAVTIPRVVLATGVPRGAKMSTPSCPRPFPRALPQVSAIRCAATPCTGTGSVSGAGLRDSSQSRRVRWAAGCCQAHSRARPATASHSRFQAMRARRRARDLERREDMARASRVARAGGGKARKKNGATLRPSRRKSFSQSRRSGGSVLELLQRTHLDLDRGRLGGEPLLFLGERVDALALRLGRDLDRGDLEQARQGEGASALLADGAGNRILDGGQHGLDVLGDDATGFGQVLDQGGLAQDFLQRGGLLRSGGSLLRSSSLLHCGRLRRFGRGLLGGRLLGGLRHKFPVPFDWM